MRCEGLGRYDEERRFGIQALERLGDVRAVDVRYEMRRDIRLVGRERFAHHARTEVGTADTDINDVGNRLAGIALPFARAYARAERLHLIEYAIDVGHDVFSVDVYGRVATIAQRGVQYGAAFGDIDFLAGEHSLGFFLDLRLFRERDEQIERLFRYAILGEIV